MAGRDDHPRQPRGVEQPLFLVEVPAARLLRHQPPLQPVGEPRDDPRQARHLLVEIGAQPKQFLVVAQFGGGQRLVEPGGERRDSRWPARRASCAAPDWPAPARPRRRPTARRRPSRPPGRLPPRRPRPARRGPTASPSRRRRRRCRSPPRRRRRGPRPRLPRRRRNLRAPGRPGRRQLQGRDPRAAGAPVRRRRAGRRWSAPTRRVRRPLSPRSIVRPISGQTVAAAGGAAPVSRCRASKPTAVASGTSSAVRARPIASVRTRASTYGRDCPAPRPCCATPSASTRAVSSASNTARGVGIGRGQRLVKLAVVMTQPQRHRIGSPARLGDQPRLQARAGRDDPRDLARRPARLARRRPRRPPVAGDRAGRAGQRGPEPVEGVRAIIPVRCAAHAGQGQFAGIFTNC